MKIAVIVAHPNLAASRINKAWVEELQKHEHITTHCLYEAYPDESINVEREQLLLEKHNRIILQYPFYWYSTPPLLKKWFDSVMLPGWAYGSGGIHMSGKEIGVAISTYGSADSYKPDGFNRFTMQQLLRPVEALAHFVSATYKPPFVLHDSSAVSDEQLEQSQRDFVRHITS
ncbi:NAD(P)H-dependent oxidoreductase [Paenibacillus sp. GCM10027627]|uniref:NAD(P)H-dependent oxidoreductase n=1 Tax=unclassified Paenibacillus TaxID=185978 RepID=UPI003642AB28